MDSDRTSSQKRFSRYLKAEEQAPSWGNPANYPRATLEFHLDSKELVIEVPLSGRSRSRMEELELRHFIRKGQANPHLDLEIAGVTSKLVVMRMVRRRRTARSDAGQELGAFYFVLPKDSPCRFMETRHREATLNGDERKLLQPQLSPTHLRKLASCSTQIVVEALKPEFFRGLSQNGRVEAKCQGKAVPGKTS